ncbi:hypothetical protein MGG_10877 [Pyricularia oryzae 70-15]|uniref:Peroxidase n=1 Tax=Pyricularia oryzae (strain 70-15 / ATCC MYA-4617 / FGSC 8958) TaxID=242507 RepID=G4NG46_PYRO7|nr:uncharacterized protein MGG_10877 [Pyricularia oryzae 70-15]EHA47003.1 hypothetical protein MGG_10877 [Pyricularia oryzae 70-15]KAI7911900.1 hypothetical protein M9X92_010319 [Pyricularia oryzae]KAI7912911.1 hypothetical protein M0657_010251 [Pyricularia oryzae]
MLASLSSSSLLVASLLFVTAPVPVNGNKLCNPWKPVVADLKASFKGCNADARMAMRAAFHDCFPGSCDGSLILANECNDRPDDNGPLVPICDTLAQKAIDFKVGTADLIQAAGVVAITSCAGPRTYFYVGRKDSSVPSPEGQLPNSESTAQQQIDACKAKGFTTTDLVAMVGAHSAGVSQQGLSFDSTPEKLDSTVFYPETASEKGPTSLQSDYALSNDTQTKTAWKNMGRSNALWRAQFVTTMRKVTLMGNTVKSLTDCSYLI